ncbi:MAG: M43 family zinc metalloprotease, partial [Bacteroidota bacterium]
MKRIFTLPILLLSFFLLQAQDHGHDHERCSFRQIHQELAEENPEFQRELDYYHEVVLPRIAQQAQSRNSNNEPLTVSIVYHIAGGGDPIGVGQNISDERIYAQTELLNQCFYAENLGFDNAPDRWADVLGNSNIQFCLASVDPNGQPTNGIMRYTEEAGSSDAIDQFKQQVQWDPLTYLNIYITPLSGGLLGFAYLPTPGIIGDWRDGCVVDYEVTGAPVTGQGGKTLVHEVGHYLGLNHIWSDTGGSGCNRDDGIEDTPIVASPSNFNGCAFSSFPQGPVTCENESMYINFMDYASDDCQIAFTNGQIEVMRAVLEGRMTSLGWGSRKTLIDRVASVCNPEDLNGVRFDAALKSITAPSGVSCSNVDITPTVTVSNEGTEVITEFTVNYRLSTGPRGSTTVDDPLAPGTTMEVQLPSFVGPDSEYTITASVAAVVDQNVINDEIDQKIIIFEDGIFPFTEDFESGNF